MTIEVESIAFHRNGVSGEGFHVVTFFDVDRPMVGVVFESKGSVAVFERDLLGQGQIAFGINSWRGDLYERELRTVIQEWEGSGRSDPSGTVFVKDL